MIVLEAKNIVKHYGGVIALNSANLSLKKGEIHFLVGSNGSGKSTLAKIIAGTGVPDAGEISLSGKVVQFNNPIESKKSGISVVYQELSLIPYLTVAENIMLGNEPRTKMGFIDYRKLKKQAKYMADLFRSAIYFNSFNLDTLVYQLPPAEKQIIEILKVLVNDPKIIIFDEATASLHKNQVKVFFELIRKLREKGKSVLIISHRMDEVFEIGDRATILRNGKTVSSVNLRESSKEEVVYLMVGRKIDVSHSKIKSEIKRPVALKVEALSSNYLENVSFELKKGEILGVGGLHGQGQSKLLLTLFGALPLNSGTVIFKDKKIGIDSPIKAMKHSFTYISGDRKKYGIFLIRPILDNMILSFLVKMKKIFFREKILIEKVSPVIKKLKLIFNNISDLANELSGGNQQKVVIGRGILTNPDIILMDDPTKGIDIQAKEEFYVLMKSMCKVGISIIWNSSEDQELLSNANRIIVFNEGKIVDVLKGKRMNEFDLYNSIYGHETEATKFKKEESYG